MKTIITCFLILLFSSAHSQLQTDIKLWSVVSPANGITPDCQKNDTVPVTVIYENVGLDTLENVPVSFQLDGGTIINDTITYVEPGLFYLFTFDSVINISASGSHSLIIWTSLPGDMDLNNDTAFSNVVIVSGTLLQIPVLENFDNYSLCDTTANCSAGICSLGIAWVNEQNTVDDSYDFRVNSGSTPTDSTGPDNDHTHGDSTGNYIYIESSGCSGGSANLKSACIDLTNAVDPQLYFWYHMYGSGSMTLTIEIYSRGRWYSNQIQAITGDHGNQWNREVLNLAAYAGEIINIRFQEFGNGDPTSDFALDDILIAESDYLPFASIGISKGVGCTGSTILLTDASNSSNTSWNWSITPAGYVYINGTDSLSQFPQVQFTSAGVYSVELIVSNAFGSDTAFASNVIQIFDPVPVNTMEDFESGIFPPAGYIAGDLDGWDWSTASVTGSTGTSTTAMMSPNYVNENTGTFDEISTIGYDLNSVIAPILTFDVAYARYNALKSDTLRIDISTDCGATYTPSGYYKGGQTLATVPDQTVAFFPTQSIEWRKDSILLSAWQSPEVLIRFVNINGWGNNLFIDNIHIRSAVSVSENVKAIKINVWPNPATETLNINYKLPSSSAVEYLITNTIGQEMYRSDAEELNSGPSSKRIDVSHFREGIYFVTIHINGQQVTQKFVVIH